MERDWRSLDRTESELCLREDVVEEEHVEITDRLESLRDLSNRISRHKEDLLKEIETMHRKDRMFEEGERGMEPTRRSSSRPFSFRISAMLDLSSERNDSKVREDRNGKESTSIRARYASFGDRLDHLLSLHELYLYRSEETMDVLLFLIKDAQVKLAVSESGRKALEACIPKIATTINESYVVREMHREHESESYVSTSFAARTIFRKDGWNRIRKWCVQRTSKRTWNRWKNGLLFWSPCFFMGAIAWIDR